jgi:hypothetical protein
MTRGFGKLALTAALSSAVTLAAVWGVGGAAPAVTAKLENARVRVSEVVTGVGGVRQRGVRANDQVIVFLDDCSYERLDPVTGEKTVRQRKSGDVIWHSKGEDAPRLTNVGTRPYRTIVFELK